MRYLLSMTIINFLEEKRPTQNSPRSITTMSALSSARRSIILILGITYCLSNCAEAHFPTSTKAAFVVPNVESVALQVTAGVASYVGLVAWFDRPKGSLTATSSLKIAPSQVPGAGLGLYATSTIPKNTILGTYPGVVMPLDQGLVKLNMAPCCETYIWRFSDSKFIIDPTDSMGRLQDYTLGGNPSTWASVQLCTTILSGFRVPTTLCRINEPPIGMDRNVCTDEDLDKRLVKFVTERQLYPGEELFIDYGLTYDRSGYRKGK